MGEKKEGEAPVCDISFEIAKIKEDKMLKRIYCDMDGVLATFNPHATPGQLLEAGYFLSRPAENEMIEIVKELAGDPQNEVFILSCVIPEIADRAIAEKDEWLDRYLPEVRKSHRLYPHCGTDKVKAIGAAELCRYDILLDDHSPNCRLWQKKNGIAIKILNGINGNGGSYTGIRAVPEEIPGILRAL